MPAPKKTSSPHNKLLVLVFLISLFTLAITALNLKRAHDLVNIPSVSPETASFVNKHVAPKEFFLVEPLALLLPADTYRGQSKYYYFMNSYSLSAGETGHSIRGSVSMYSKDPSVFASPETKGSVNSVTITYGGVSSDFSEGREGTATDVSSLSANLKAEGVPGSLQKIGEISFAGGKAYIMKGLENCDDMCLYAKGTYYAFVEVSENAYGFGALVFEYPGDRSIGPFEEYLSRLRLVK